MAITITDKSIIFGEGNYYGGGLTLSVDEGILSVMEYGTHVPFKCPSITLGGTFQGTHYGFVSGGTSDSTIERYSFSTDENSTFFANMNTYPASYNAGFSSATDGFLNSKGSYYANIAGIQKFSFYSEGSTSSFHTQLFSNFRRGSVGVSSSTEGFIGGGRSVDGSYFSPLAKFSFFSDSNSTIMGILEAVSPYDGMYACTGVSSSSSGYFLGGVYDNGSPKVFVTNYRKFNFSDPWANATIIGTLTADARQRGSGHSSLTHGYVAGGRGGYQMPGVSVTTIEKFSFATDGNASAVGEFLPEIYGISGTSSTTHGYINYRSGGSGLISKFPFSSSEISTSVGSLTTSRENAMGHQY